MKYGNSWHLFSAEDTLKSLSVDPFKGISFEEADRKLENDGENDVWVTDHYSIKNVIEDIVFDFTTLLSVLCIVISAFMGQYSVAVSLFVVFIIGMILRIVFYVLSRNIIEESTLNRIPRVSVIREGRTYILPAGKIVNGDIVFLSPGDIVPADCRVISPGEVIVSERGITNNRTSVHKYDTVIRTDDRGSEVPCEFRSNMIFAGSRILSGNVKAVVVSQGRETLICRKKGPFILKTSVDSSQIQSMNNTGKYLNLATLCLILVATLLIFIKKDSLSLQNTLLFTASISATMTGFLGIFGYLSLAYNIRSCTKNWYDPSNSSFAYFTKLENIDHLSRSDYCVIIGTDCMKSGNVEIAAFGKDAAIMTMSSVKDAAESEEGNVLFNVLKHAYSASTILDVTGNSQLYSRREGSAYSDIITRVTDYANSGNRAYVGYLPRIDHLVNVNDSVELSINISDGETIAIACGDILPVIEYSDTVDGENGKEVLTPEAKNNIVKSCKDLEMQGYVVFAAATKPTSYTKLDKPAIMTHSMHFLGYVAVKYNPETEGGTILRKARETICSLGIRQIFFVERGMYDYSYLRNLGLIEDKCAYTDFRYMDSVDWSSVKEYGLVVDFSKVNKEIPSGLIAETCDKMVQHLTETDEFGFEIAPTYTVVGSQMSHAKAMNQSKAGILLVNSGLRNMPSPLYAASSAVVETNRRSSRNGYGGYIGMSKTLETGENVLRTTETIRKYFIASQTAKLISMLLILLFDLDFVSPVFILFWGAVFDFVSAISVTFSKYYRDTSYRVKKRTVQIHSILTGLLWGGLNLAMAPILKAAFAGIGDQQITSVVSAGLVLTGIAVSFEMQLFPPRYKIRNISFTQIAYILIASSFATCILYFSPLAKVFAGDFSGLYSLFSLIPPVLIIIIMELERRID